MKLLSNQPIQRKLLLITMSICAAVLLVTLIALCSFQVFSFRSNFKRDTATLATIIANNSTAALAFNDRKTASEIIGSLKAKPTVLCACLVNLEDEVVAHFGVKDDTKELAEFPLPGSFRFLDGCLLYTEAVNLEGKTIGNLYLRSDYNRVLLELLGFYSVIMVLVAIGTALLAFQLSRRLGRIVTIPILNLAETARLVGENNDYSVRSNVAGQGDEVGTLATAFNHMLGRIQSQDAALSLSQQKLESLVHSIDGIVWEWDPQTRAFGFVSQQSRQILGYAAECWVGKPEFWSQLVHPDDLEAATKGCEQALARGQPYHQEYRMIAEDRRVVWIYESGVVLVENGRPVAVRGIFQDITKQKEAAEELKRLNSRLVDTSRQAGMAEIATGVLHNVGNVLNSVNVSASLVQEQMAKSKIQTLEMATGLLREHLGDAAQFIANDPKGRLLPDFLVKVTGLAAREQARWQQELKELRSNVEHMKEIVAMQQSYARVAGVFESLPPGELVEDALRINAVGLARHGVEVVRDFRPVPKAKVDKHKVMQILINLIRNAIFALESPSSRQKTLTVRIDLSDTGRVKIVVQDNGIGIPQENLTLIFSHGFTTRKDGHGFGLHSGALAARELGGSLSVHSDGPGTGASFTLELPLADSIS